MIMTEKAKEVVKISMPTLIALFSTLAITVGAFTVVRNQTDTNSANHLRHETSDDKRYDKMSDEVEELEDRVVLIEKADIRRAAEYAALLDDNGEIKDTLTLVLQELKRLELDNGKN